jgi:hypothetical protein
MTGQAAGVRIASTAASGIRQSWFSSHFGLGATQRLSYLDDELGRAARAEALFRGDATERRTDSRMLTKHGRSDITGDCHILAYHWSSARWTRSRARYAQGFSADPCPLPRGGIGELEDQADFRAYRGIKRGSCRRPAVARLSHRTRIGQSGLAVVSEMFWQDFCGHSLTARCASEMRGAEPGRRR